MKVIGAGFGRTATMSLMMGLDQLGFKTYHMEKVFQENHVGDWGLVHAGDGKQDDAQLERVLDRIAAEGFTAGVDFPINFAYKELMRRNPDSPVILSVRKTPEVWAKSYLETIDKIYQASDKQRPPVTLVMPRFHNLTRWMRWKSGIPLGRASKEAAAAAYSAWLVDVQANVPKEKLLIWKVEDGWEPICAHLQIPTGQCPSDRGESFPFAPNDSANMKHSAWLLNVVTDWFYALAAALLFVIVVLLRIVAWCCCRTGAKEKQG